MKSLKKLGFLFLGLSLVFSLSAFSGLELQPQTQVFKTSLVVSQTHNDAHFSITFQQASKAFEAHLNRSLNFSFYPIRLSHGQQQAIAFKSYTTKAFHIRFKKLHNELFTSRFNKTFYRHNIV